MAARLKGRRIDGVFLLNKPAGVSSNGALQRVKRLYGAAKAGHTGALDPLATGMLPICLGEATKFSQFLLDSDKRYLTTAKLGVRTDTCDAEGEATETRPISADVNQALVERLLAEHFLGEIEQVPPIYSALKHNGQPLYKLARKGVQVEVKPRRVTIRESRLVAFRGDELDIEIACSKGTYIRTIVDDLGQLLGCGAHVLHLHRISTGSYDSSMMRTFEELQAEVDKLADPADDKGIQDYLDGLLLPPWSAIDHLPACELDEQDAQRLLFGQSCRLEGIEPEQQLRLFERTSRRFLGLGEVDAEGVLKARRLINTADA
ncbi:tRNA pseudouridine(55) synthase TruB [Nitrincola alkalilacustris]|uniref:tRNA pseudouridine(55) synthase TruB n=1 Tax=Nitrincola alkalilacustris TaxID=1571224 RepID=UPI00124DDD27|nr:tRNA pseudouridine(55) synthase TruB [Nitrincola alkalilacustris]